MKYVLALLLAASATVSAQDSTQLLRLPNNSNRFNIMEYVNPPQNFGDAHVCLWEDDKEGTFTFTIDGVWSSNHAFWVNAAARFGFPVTFFVITHTVGTGNWSPWHGAGVDEFYDLGNGVQSHSAYHNNEALHDSGLVNLWIEYRGSKDSVESAMPYNPCYTIAYPGGGWPNDIDSAILAGYNGGRGTTARPNPANGIPYMNVYSSSGWDTVKVNTLLDPTALVFSKSYRYGWSSFHMHSINGADSTISGYLQYLKDREDRLWLARFADVIRYGQERDSHALTVTSVDDNLITFNLTDAMHDSVFTYPLTVKVKVDSSWDTVAASQDGNPVAAALKTDSTGIYALVKAVPDQGEVTVSNGQSSFIHDMPADVVSAVKVDGVLYDMAGRQVVDPGSGCYLRYDAGTNSLKKVMVIK